MKIPSGVRLYDGRFGLGFFSLLVRLFIFCFWYIHRAIPADFFSWLSFKMLSKRPIHFFFFFFPFFFFFFTPNSINNCIRLFPVLTSWDCFPWKEAFHFEIGRAFVGVSRMLGSFVEPRRNNWRLKFMFMFFNGFVKQMQFVISLLHYPFLGWKSEISPFQGRWSLLLSLFFFFFFQTFKSTLRIEKNANVDRVWKCLKKFERVWKSLKEFERVWRCFEIFI